MCILRNVVHSILLKTIPLSLRMCILRNVVH